MCVTAVLVLYNLLYAFQSGFSLTGKALAKAAEAGILEELLFRGVIVGGGMRLFRSEKRMPVLVWVSSAAFGLVHLINIFAGAAALETGFQVYYAIGLGILFAGEYLAWHSLIPCIASHTLIDFTALLNTELSGTGGLLSGSASAGELLFSAAVGTACAVCGLRLIRKKYREEIYGKWK